MRDKQPEEYEALYRSTGRCHNNFIGQIQETALLDQHFSTYVGNFLVTTT